MERMTLSVTELNTYVKTLVDRDPVLLDLCVRGELSNYKIYPSGHHYFTLKDQESSLKCVMFRPSAAKLRFRPENGMRVSAFGRISVYLRDGVYQLNCTAMMPEGIGDLQVAFEQLKEKLAEEGLFDASHKKPLPPFPERIAIITSSAGAAVHDMIRILGRRWPMTRILLMPVRVQGVEAPPEIAGAIRYANEFSLADLIITGRGGGSLEDLWAFNDERVARAIYASRIPVISAVGHEPDVTISDYVADRRASTPSNAAEIAVPDWHEMLETLQSYQIRAGQAVEKTLKSSRQKLEELKNKRVLNDPGVYLDQRYMDLDRERDRLLAGMERLLAEKKHSFVKLGAALDAMSPLRVLARGYTLSTDEAGNVLRSVHELRPGDSVGVSFLDGRADCRVERITEGA